MQGERGAAKAHGREMPEVGPDGAPGTAPEEPSALFPKLTARRNAPREVVAAHQRARLHAAMIEACRRHGYPATTARELVALAGVSTRALYGHFEGVESCFLATYELIVSRAVGRISSAYRAAAESEEWSAGLCRAFDAFGEELVDRPDASRLALIDVLAVGPPALDHIERAESTFAWMIRRALAQRAGGEGVPPAIVRALIGGVWFVSRTRLQEGRADELAQCGQGLFGWILSYCAEGARLDPEIAPVPARPPDVLGPPARARTSEERLALLQATAEILSTDGYRSLSAGEIAGIAGLPSACFEDCFESIDDCFLATLEMLSAKALARALREADGAPDWATGVRRAVATLFQQMVEDQAFARAAFLDSFLAGPAGVGRRSDLISGFAQILVARAPESRRPSPLVAEAIAGSVWSMAHRQVARRQIQRLPALAGLASFVVLAPLVGPARASEIVRTDGRGH